MHAELLVRGYDLMWDERERERDREPDSKEHDSWWCSIRKGETGGGWGSALDVDA